MKVGDLVRAKHWANKETAIVLSTERGGIIKVALSKGWVIDQYVHDLEVISESR